MVAARFVSEWAGTPVPLSLWAHSWQQSLWTFLKRREHVQWRVRNICPLISSPLHPATKASTVVAAGTYTIMSFIEVKHFPLIRWRRGTVLNKPLPTLRIMPIQKLLQRLMCETKRRNNQSCSCCNRSTDPWRRTVQQQHNPTHSYP